MTDPTLSVLRAVARQVVPSGARPSALLRRTVQARTGMRVHAGPFRGLRLPRRAVWGAHIPKLLGTYELELQGCLEEAIADSPSSIVDIGAAEGFYAVGMLLRLPSSRVVAFEQLDDARSLTRQTARDNGVEERLEVRGSCDPAGLRAALAETGATLIISDVEGYEVELLDPDVIPALRHVHLLVEVHDAQRPGCRETLERRFAASHDVKQLEQRVRRIEDYPFQDVWARLWPRAVLEWGLNEFRSPGNGWLWMRARRPVR